MDNTVKSEEIVELKSFSQIYIKYIIKTPVLFFLYISIGVGLFLFMTLSLQLDVMATYKASYHDGMVFIISKDPIDANKIYLYEDRNEKVYTVLVDHMEFEESTVIFHIQEADIAAADILTGDITVDVINSKESLFKKIFIKAGKN